MNTDTMKYLIVPDVHGRKFWENPVRKVLGETDKKVIFLGDYLDPYGYEEIYPVDAIREFKKILALKQANPDRIILLLGNHDVENLDPRAHKVRFDYANAESNAKLYQDNKDLFEFVHIDEFAGKTFIFSHAGFNPGWLEYNCDNIPAFCPPEDCTSEELWNMAANVDIIKNTDWKDLYFNGTPRQKDMFNDVSSWRGGEDSYSSLIWADVKESINILDGRVKWNDSVQIVGHSQQENKPVRLDDKLYCLDVRRCFILTENGTVTELDGTELENNGEALLNEYYDRIKKYGGFFW